VGLNRLPGDLEMTGNVRGQETSGGTWNDRLGEEKTTDWGKVRLIDERLALL
jgi:hypothetical protein